MTKNSNPLNIATFNAVSTVARKRKEWLLSLLLEKRIDIAFIQETRISTHELAKDFVQYFGHVFRCFHTLTLGDASGGTAVLVKKKKCFSVVDCELGAGGRVSRFDCLVKNELVCLVSVYAPNDAAERCIFFSSP